MTQSHNFLQQNGDEADETSDGRHANGAVPDRTIIAPTAAAAAPVATVASGRRPGRRDARRHRRHSRVRRVRARHVVGDGSVVPEGQVSALRI